MYKHDTFSGLILPLIIVLFWAFGASSSFAQVPLGSAMPGQDVNLSASDGSGTSLGALKGDEATLVVFWGNRCPWVGKIEDRLKEFSSNFSSDTRKIILVNSNDGAAFETESLASNRDAAASMPAGITYVSDPDAELMNAFGASRTPEFFLFDSSDALAYTGSIDDSPGDGGKVTKTYLSDAYAAISSGSAVRVGSTKPFGCMIKPKR